MNEAASESEPPSESQSAAIELAVGGRKLRMNVSASTGPTRPADLLPLIRSLADAFTSIAVEAVEERGQKISCKYKCAACCRQLIPLSEIEVRGIVELVSAMPEPRRSEVRARFAMARRQLEDAGLLERLLKSETIAEDEFVPFALGYFRHAIACPFLEDESCAIYAERPMACREYMVTTPAENCWKLAPEIVQSVKLKVDVTKAMDRLGSDESFPHRKWVSLILAPEWAEAHPDQSVPRPGTELVREFFEYLSGQTASDAGVPGDEASSVRMPA